MEAPDVAVRRVSDTLQQTIRRLATLVTGVGLVVLLIGAATFLAGWRFFGGDRQSWVVIGGVICLIPIIAAAVARFVVRRTADHVPELANEVRLFLDTSVHAAKVLIDHDSGKPVSGYVKSFKTVRSELKDRRKDFPALFASVKAITSVPGLAAIAVLGALLVGGLGTILLIGSLVH